MVEWLERERERERESERERENEWLCVQDIDGVRVCEFLRETADLPDSLPLRERERERGLR